MPETTQTTESRDHQQPGDDLFQYDIAAGLEKLRGRLLDLSKRNQLLNFRYAGGRGMRRQLRFVEANMGLVLKRLRAEEEYGLRAVPYPRPGGQADLPGMISFDEFTNNPETYLDGEENEEVLAPVGPGRMKAEEYALKLDIDTSYELPEVTGVGVQVEVGGRGNELQVLHYGDELDQVVRAIADVNRTAEREMGVRTLYLIFGFVEWYDEAGGDVSRLAPLLLMPVVLGRRQTDGRAPGVAHTLEWTGEEVEVNRTLQMMLRQRFGINLPEFRESDSLESYLLRVRPLLTGQPRWRVRHQLTLTNLSFHKLRMWEDLDPQSWPDKRLLEHPLVRDFFVGRPIEAFNSMEESIDDLEVSGELPPLIFDADSSQHSALVDVQRGKSLVIEGPPGTGKSQTITNLIAAALNEGRTVLFVAEKTTALAVVQRKMVEAGLGDFCLCLGHRAEEDEDGEPRFLTRMRDIAANLRQRIANRGSYELPVRLGQKREILRDYRTRLNDYVWTINQPCGIGGGAAPPTIGQTIGIRERLYQSLVAVLGGPDRMAELEAMRLEGAEGLTLARIEAFEENARIYEQALAQLVAGAGRTPQAAGPWAGPWSGLKRESLDPDEEQAILSSLQSIIGLTNQIEAELDSFTLENDLPLAGYERSVKRLIDLAPLLPVVEPGLARELLPALADPESRREVRRLSRLGREYQAGYAALSGQFSRLPDLGIGELEQLRAACQQAAAADVEALTIDELRQKAEWLMVVANYLTGAAPLFTQLIGHLECELGYDLTSAKMLGRSLILLNEIPLKALPSRVPGLEREGIAPVLTRARQEAEQIRKLANSLANRVDQNMAPPLESIVRYALICSNAGLFRFVSRDFREAQRYWLGMVRQEEIRTTRQMARDYRDLLNYRKELQAFTTRAEYVEVLGPYFKGLLTPFAEYEQLVKWYDRIKLIMGLVNEPSRRLATALFTVPAASLKALIHFKDREVREEVEEFVRFFANFDQVLVGLPGVLHGEGIDDLQRLAGRLREVATEYESIVEAFARLKIESVSPVERLAGNFPALQRLGQLRELIEARQDLAPLLGVEAVDVRLDWGRIDEAVDFVERLEVTAFPTDFREWLYSAEIDYRVEMMRSTTDRLRTLYNQYLLARERFRAVTGIDEVDWYGVDPGRELSFSEVRRRAQEALRARDELPIWLITRRAHQLMIRQGFGRLAELIETGAIPIDRLTRCLVDATRFVYYNSLLMGAFRRYPRLVDFNGVEQDEVRRRFAALDREVIALTRAEIASRLDQAHVPPGNSLGPISSYTELGLILHLAANRNSRIGVRQLVRNAAGALLALKPCFMMSPLAVAKYLPPESIRFDLVVMDEASQIRPEDALGAVARGGQLVVVGDRMQLPPTAFFQSVVGDEEEVAADEPEWSTTGLTPEPAAMMVPGSASGMESMLEIASARYHPIRQLKWHYRSRHESLIAFSNREFYHDRLTVFPAPVTAAGSVGVRFCHVADGVYRQNRNQREAEAVVAAAIDHLINHPLESLGIVGLNLAQRHLLLELLERALRESPAAASRYHYWQARGEELFVKNLEMVQGDERDVIFISGTVGPDPDGRFRLSSFGPLTNTRDGHRRLNVLVTRARQRVVLFSSITPELIQPGVNSSWGIRAVKDYLTYAMTGELGRSPHFERPPAAEFEIAVADTLRARGFEVVSPVGEAGCQVDLAIRHPQLPDRYVLGIECDGAGYRRSRSVRDRDRLRQSVLEGLGWKIHRIWSTDWLRSREREINRVVDLVAGLVDRPPSP